MKGWFDRLRFLWEEEIAPPEEVPRESRGEPVGVPRPLRIATRWALIAVAATTLMGQVIGTRFVAPVDAAAIPTGSHTGVCNGICDGNSDRCIQNCNGNQTCIQCCMHASLQCHACCQTTCTNGPTCETTCPALFNKAACHP